MKANFQTLCMAFLWLFGSVSLSAYLNADGREIFGVVIEVREDFSEKPLDSVDVSLTDSGSDQLGNFDRNGEMKRYLTLFAPSTTNLAGQTMVYYYGGFSEETGKGKTQGVCGKLLLKKSGYEDVNVELREILGPSVKTDGKNLPRAVCHMKKR